MMTPVDKLTMMANQIGQFFRSYPRDQAIAGIAHHVEAFWTPRMRQTLIDGLAAARDVDPLVRAALSPDSAKPHAPNPVEKIAAGPGAVGELGAVDAG